MEITTFLEKFTDILDESPAELLSPETVFRNIEEWDSLTALSLIAMADDEYSVKLTGDDIKSSITLKDLFDKINSKV